MTDSIRDLQTKTVNELFALRRQMKSVSQNPNNSPLFEPTQATITAIDARLVEMGYGSIIKPVIFIQWSLN